MARFSKLAARPSLVLTARITGFPARSMLFAPRVTGVSLMPWASFARVAPVQGAMIIAPAMFWGPRGSAPCSVSMGWLPVAAYRRIFQSAARPKRVSSPAALKLISGRIFVPPAAMRPMSGRTFSKVQKLPHSAHTTVLSSIKTPLPSLAAWPERPAPQTRPPSPARTVRAGSAHGWR